jgi:hypothetical protein
MRIPRSTPGLRAVHARIVLSLALVLTLTGCGSGGGAGSTPWAPPGSEGLPFATLGELEDAIAEASVSPIPEERIDTDGDSIQDVVEVRLGTAPGQSDTDRDGLVDGAELFPDGWRRPDPMTASDPRATVTRALEAFEAGETADIESLLPLLYD